MAKKTININTVFILAGFTMMILLGLFIFRATINTYIIFLVIWIILIAATLIYLKAKSDKEREEEIKADGKIFLDDVTSEQLIDSKIEEKNIIAVNCTGMIERNIQPEDPDKPSTQYFTKVFQHKYRNDLYFFAYINRKTGIVNLIRSEDQWTDKAIKEKLELAAESTREYVNTILTRTDPISGITTKEESKYRIPPTPRVAKAITQKAEQTEVVVDE